MTLRPWQYFELPAEDFKPSLVHLPKLWARAIFCKLGHSEIDHVVSFEIDLAGFDHGILRSDCR